MCVFTSDGLVGYTPQETQQSSPSLHIRKTTGDMGRRADEALFKPTKTNCTQNKKLQTKNDGFHTHTCEKLLHELQLDTWSCTYPKGREKLYSRAHLLLPTLPPSRTQNRTP
jgi:hypothetical protein